MAKGFKDKDKGFKSITEEIKAFNGLTLTVGILSSAGQHPSGANMADIATFNEFGTRNIPARSFLRSTFDENADDYQSFIARLAGTLGKSKSAKQAAELLGLKMVGDVQKKIVDVRTPPNAPATIAKKGFDNPLIQTGRLRQSIAYEVK